MFQRIRLSLLRTENWHSLRNTRPLSSMPPSKLQLTSVFVLKNELKPVASSVRIRNVFTSTPSMGDAPDNTSPTPKRATFPLGEEYTLVLTEEEMQELTGGDPELVKKVKYIQLEHDLMRQEALKVPAKIKLSKWKELLTLRSRSQRLKFYDFLWKTEMKRENQVKKKIEKKAKLQPLPELVPDPTGMTYGLTKNTLFLRFYDSTMTRHLHAKMCQSIMFNPPVVIDLGYDIHMTTRECNNCSKQLEMLLTDNRRRDDPLNIYLCNAYEGNGVLEYLHKKIPTLFDDGYVLNISKQSYLDIFPREKLVYLSPHAKQEMDRFNEDEIYIIGAMVDKTDPRPFSLAKAKKENVRIKKLPLDKYLDWGLGSKSLTVNQMGNILGELRATGSWEKAFKFVPTRKLRNDNGHPDEQPFRKESKTSVYEDAYLMNRNKGLRFNKKY